MGRKPKHGEGIVRFNLSLTPTAKSMLDAKAQEMGISRAELVERFARGELSLTDTQEEVQVVGET